MRLNEKDYYQYINFHLKLMYYFGKKKGLLDKGLTLQEFRNFTSQEKFPCRNAVYDNIELLDQFMKDSDLSEEETELALQFKDFKRGTFYIIKLTEKHALFLDDNYVYAVLALSDPFYAFWNPRDLPIMVEAVLLPHKGKIIYDGMISNYPIRLGRGITSNIKKDFNLAKAKYGIITQLPIDTKILRSKISAEQTLSILMKTKSSREQNWYEIEEMLDNNPKLIPFFTKECGRINSRKKKKVLRALGIKNQYFAICDETIIASGKTEKEVIQSVNRMIPNKEDLDAIFYFKI